MLRLIGILLYLAPWLWLSSPALMAQAESQQTRFTAAELKTYASELAPLIAGRAVSSQERRAIDQGNYQAFTDILKAWTLGPKFPRLARQMVTEFTRLGGKTHAFEADLPGNLVEFLAKERRPYSELLTATSCYDKNLQAIACDTGAPYTAGLLTTRSYMKGHAGRFNLSRAIALMEDFMCKSYPMKEAFQPYDPKDQLIDLFAQNSNSAEKSPNNLGFGRVHCYSCHGQFSAHTQFFVRFDAEGLYRAEVTGQQAPDRQPGESGSGEHLLYTSHFKDSARSSQESSQILGSPVPQLHEAAKILVKTRAFKECAVRRVIAYGARLERNQVMTIQDLDVEMIVNELEREAPQPSFVELFYSVFKQPRVISAMLRKS